MDRKMISNETETSGQREREREREKETFKRSGPSSFFEKGEDEKRCVFESKILNCQFLKM